MSMIGNGKQQIGIPKEQIGIYHCDVCEEPGVFQPLACVQFVFDKLKPADMKPMPVTMYRCLKCEGFLMRGKDGQYKTVHVAKQEPGDEWKSV